jgi:hypothetical protein
MKTAHIPDAAWLAVEHGERLCAAGLLRVTILGPGFPAQSRSLIESRLA